jgi:hypothetical protein
MKVNLKALKNKIEGEVLRTGEHRSAVLDEKALRDVKGGMVSAASDSCCPCEDDCVD